MFRQAVSESYDAVSATIWVKSRANKDSFRVKVNMVLENQIIPLP